MIIKKFKKISSSQEIYWTFAYQAILFLGGIFLIKLLAVSLSIKDYGYYSLITAILSLVFVFPFGVFLQGIGRYISIYQNKGKYKDFFSIVVIIFVVLILLYLILAFSLKYLINLEKTWNDIFIYIVVFAISEIFKGLFSTINNTNRQRKNLAISSIIEFGLKLGLIYFTYFYSQTTLENVLIALILGNSFASLIMVYKNKNLFGITPLNNKATRIYILRIWLFSYPLLIWAIFGWLRDMSNRWYLDYFLGKEEVAHFTMIGSIALIAPTALHAFIGNFFVPILYQQENLKKGYIKKFLSYLLPLVFLIFMIGFIIIYIYKNELILLIADKKYLEISWMLPWMFSIYSFYSLSMMATYELFAHKQTSKLIISSIVPGLISFCGGYFLIKNYGLNGALYNYALTYISYSALTFYVVFLYWRKK